MRVIRVFPRKTAMTPTDDYAFIGDPPMFLPPADEAHISCAFTWDKPEAQRLAQAWGQYYPTKLGGCAFGSPANGFLPGMYVRRGVIVTSRGCNNQCPWCLVPEREGKLREIQIHSGSNILDNNILQCSKGHIRQVFDMLRTQHSIHFSGGLDARLLTDSIVGDLRSLRIKQLFFACDYKEAIKPLERAQRKLEGFTQNQLRCYTLLAYKGETLSQALERLTAVWELGFMPFAQLYQPPGEYIDYSREWRQLAWVWSRPAAMKAVMKGSEHR